MNNKEFLLQRMVNTLQSKSFLPNSKLTRKDINSDDFFHLLNSEDPEHYLNGLYLIPFIPQEIVNLEKLNSSEISTRNYANYYLMETWDGLMSCPM